MKKINRKSAVIQPLKASTEFRLEDTLTGALSQFVCMRPWVKLCFV